MAGGAEQLADAPPHGRPLAAAGLSSAWSIDFVSRRSKGKRFSVAKCSGVRTENITFIVNEEVMQRDEDEETTLQS
ncbi:hypothetical protein EYF80_064136 [Liparis tanakae]|uniref:Uncharacterized protein n=1 Tax=Liparis tanakae TaxID=230148 RepID=A0A4Z2EBR6_9TELE|nr:hypothetical protein EYF80_064136 [Liparis tanakae]